MGKKLTSRSLKLQGNKAEKAVSTILHSLGNAYHVYDNVIIKTKNGTTQIDHIVISIYGVFVIETKSHKGLIFGDCNSKNWTQVLYSKTGCFKYQFYSPFLQNYGHLKNLYKLFNLDYRYFLGLIVFTSDSVNLSNVNCSCVVHISSLYNTIMMYHKQLFTSEQVSHLQGVLEKNNCQSTYFDRKHIKYVKSIKN